jgi:hypothetical protein
MDMEPTAFGPGSLGNAQGEGIGVGPGDEELARLLAARWQDREVASLEPPAELLARWAERFGTEPSFLAEAFHRIVSVPGDVRRREAAFASQRLQDEEPLRVVPLLLRATFGCCEAILTHLVQYPSGSVVELRLRAEVPAGTPVHFLVGLRVEAEREAYTVLPMGGHGGGRVAERHFLVTPALPDDLAGVRLYLVEGDEVAPPHVERPERPVPFERRQG